MRFFRTLRRSVIASSLAALVALGACKSDPAEQSPATTHPPAEDSLRGELMVFAASSLTDAFGALAQDFQNSHPGVRITLNFAGSQSLRTKIENGAQPQVVASANQQHIDALEQEALINAPVTFIHNELIIVVPPNNPAGINALGDLPRARRLVLASKNVPAGAYAEAVFENAAAEYGEGFPEAVRARVVSRETNVRHTLQKVVLGEADAAIVYATDAVSVADKVKAIPIPTRHNILASYPIATVRGAPRASLGQRFIEFAVSAAGQKRLAEFGFRPVNTPGDATDTSNEEQ